MNISHSFKQKIDSQNILFVSDLPKETTIEDLALVFKNYHFLSAKLFSSKANTCAYVTFENAEYATRAKKDLNGEVLVARYSLSKIGRPMRICNYEQKKQLEISKDMQNSLLVKNLDKSISAKDFYKIFEEFGEIKSSKLETLENGTSKGYGYIYYYDKSSAEQAKDQMNGVEIGGKKLEIVNLIPNKSKEFPHTLFVKNFPVSFSEEELKKLFDKYGEVQYASIAKDDKGKSRGFGFIAFSDPETAARVIKDIKEKDITFPGLRPLFVSYTMKKEERMEKHIAESVFNIESCTMLIKMPMEDSSITNEIDFEKEIRLFIKVILLQEYSPREVSINFLEQTAKVILNSKKDIEEFFGKYNEHLKYNFPRFICYPLSSQKHLQKSLQHSKVEAIPNNSSQLYSSEFQESPLMSLQQGNHFVNTNKQIQFQDSRSSKNNYISSMPTNQPTLIASQIPNFPNFQGTQQQVLTTGFPQTNQILSAPQAVLSSNLFPNGQFVMSQQQVVPSQFENSNAYPQAQSNQITNNLFNQILQDQFSVRNVASQLNNMNINSQGNLNQQQILLDPNSWVNPIIKPIFILPQNNLPPQQEVRLNPVIVVPSSTIPNMNNNQANYSQAQRQFGGDSKHVVDPRNLLNMNPHQLQSQFRQPVQSLYPDQSTVDQNNEEIANEIADHIYDITYEIYPQYNMTIDIILREAAKITGMIKDMGVQKMNKLLSKKEQLNEIIEEAYRMIHSNSK